MTLLVLPCALALLAACNSLPEEKPAQKPAATARPKPLVNTLADQNRDQAFQAFIGRLRLVIAAHDVDTLASMMTTDFGYGQPPWQEGPGVFTYFDEHNLWPELQLIVKEHFVPLGSKEEPYMVAPAEFATNPTTYTSYRAGLQLINGSWKFAYFVSGQENEPPPR